MSREELIYILQSELKDLPVLKAYLFGSYARGEADAKSDIDLLVDLDKGVTLFGMLTIQETLEKSIHKKVDVISSNGISQHVQPFIEKDKLLIYERNNG
ncbi:MAG: nucleotidyltransferase domain-containing protein [Chitinophagales bacterium]|nr:nucleotidyltransferase domain-containing protein [Chitinophagales bacterium]